VTDGPTKIKSPATRGFFLLFARQNNELTATEKKLIQAHTIKETTMVIGKFVLLNRSICGPLIEIGAILNQTPQSLGL